MKLVLVSDNHGDNEILERIASLEFDADYYLHCGDSCLDPNSIRPFVQVKGNNDFYDLPDKLVLNDVCGHNILIIHGHRQIYYQSIDNLVYLAKENNCDVLFFGHTHMFFDETIDGVRLINPGSLLYNRDSLDRTYALIKLDSNKIIVECKKC